MVSKKTLKLGLLVPLFGWLYVTILGLRLDLYHAAFVVVLMAWLARLPKVIGLSLFSVLVGAAALYYPTMVRFGPPSLSVVAAAVNTNARESYEFLQRVALVDYLLPLLFLLVAGLFYRYVRALQQPRPLWLAGLVLLLLLPDLINDDRDYNKVVLTYKEGLFSVRSYRKERTMLYQAASQPPSWQVTAVKPKYRHYVVIIGESTRRDHMSVHGFPLNTTPFLATSKGLFLTDMVAPSYSTYFSLPYMLTLSRAGRVEGNNNIVTLARAAGFKTHWYSNQGFMGAADTDIAALALQADDYAFLKKGEWSFENHDDFMLLPKLTEALNQPSEGPKLIVLHLMGTHFQFCDRLFPGDVRLVDVNPELSCYASAVRKMDEFIKRTHAALAASGQPFSLNYFSDHGLSYEGTDAKSHGLVHNSAYKENYEIPFLFLSSDDTHQRLNPARKSGFDYLKAYAEWLGISVEELAQQPSFWANGREATQVYTREGMVSFDDLPRDAQPQRTYGQR
ncbi:MAG: phosphoethanolamine transferase [Neisseriaceae bacterium]|nr:phosphoethanolamine transferase [Neisseriaceae bacterium]MBP6860868.1 phosphoethanolamine transferase [Neisseriaceae bacterium]